jgi:hypothetical protein
VASSRREERVQRRDDARRELKRGSRQLGREGERPESPFGGLPISEVAIFVGLIGGVIGYLQSSTPALVVSLVVCGLGVYEITAREHFSGYRSHTVLLAGIPAIVAEFVIVLTVGPPAISALLLVPVAAVFGACAWFLRRRFLVARQARLAKPPPLRG